MYNANESETWESASLCSVFNDTEQDNSVQQITGYSEQNLCGDEVRGSEYA